MWTPANEALHAKWFYLFLVIHLLIWTLVPALSRHTLPLDAMEGTTWAHQFAWGYDKNPYLNAWLTALAVRLSTSSGWMIYLFSQISVVTCFWATWKLAQKMLPATAALLSVVMLEGIQYYHLHAIDFNDNTLELSLWALTIYYFYLALIKPEQKTNWMFVGFFAGLGMMAKYYTAALLGSMLVFLVSSKKNRAIFSTLPPYLGFIIFLLLILPHIIWLFHHDFLTIHYMITRGTGIPTWQNHFFYPAQFAWQQLNTFLPVVLFFGMFLVGKKSNLFNAYHSRFNLHFLIMVGFMPFVATLVLSMCFGTYLRAGWGMPLLSTWPILLFYLWKPEISKNKILVFSTTVFGLTGILICSYIYNIHYSTPPSYANYPAQKIAHRLTKEWHARFHTPLAYVAGPRFTSGSVSFYSPDHPAVFMEWNLQKSFWIHLKDLRKKGAVFVWQIGKENMPTEIQNRFPELEPIKIISFKWHTKKELPPIKMAVAILPPKRS